MRLGRRLTAGIAEDPPAPTPTAPDVPRTADVPAAEVTAPAVGTPAPARTPDPAVSRT
jgi:hypothetical protein